MQADPRIVELLNDHLTIELTAVNSYVAHSRMCANWGYERLAEAFRKIAFDEMKDTEAIIDRVLFFEGVPNMQRLGNVVLGETVREQLEISLRVEREAIEFLTGAVKRCVEIGDEATREFFAPRLLEEEEHVDWLEAQLDQIGQLGEQLYLSQQVKD